MRKAVLGGTFDPPHYGHLLVAKQVLEHVADIDAVVLMPANTNPEKKIFAPAKDRLAMTRYLEGDAIFVSTLDIDRGGVTYTKDTIKDLLSDKANSYRFIIGSDLVEQVTNWEGYRDFIQKMPFIVFPRPDYPIQTQDWKFHVVPSTNLLTANYSSTAIRERVRTGKSISGLVPEGVRQYILSHKLYVKNTYYA